MSSSTGSLAAPTPGGFRHPSEAGRPGGFPEQLASDSVASKITLTMEGYGRSEYPFVPPNTYQKDYQGQSQMTDHLAHLKGPIVGGGFNVKAHQLMRATPGGNPVPGDDVEGKDM